MLPDPLHVGGPARSLKAPPPPSLPELPNDRLTTQPTLRGESKPAGIAEEEFESREKRDALPKNQSPIFVPSTAESEKLTKDVMALLAARAAEREAEEERKRQERAERKKKKR